MAEFLHTYDIRSQITHIINSANNFVVLISPFLNELQEEVFEGIKKADERKVEVILLCGKNKQWKGAIKLDQKLIHQLDELENLYIFYIQNLHAKCYFNENSMVITSMNLYDINTVNVEFGILLDVEEDSDIYHKSLEAVAGLFNEYAYLVNSQLALTHKYLTIRLASTCHTLKQPRY
ncbi:phospholipase D-like domain-containing protein [Chloroflexota bacterium]